MAMLFVKDAVKKMYNYFVGDQSSSGGEDNSKLLAQNEETKAKFDNMAKMFRQGELEQENHNLANEKFLANLRKEGRGF